MPVQLVTTQQLHLAATGDPAHDLPWDPTDPRGVLAVDLAGAGPDAMVPLTTAVAAVVVGTTTAPVDDVVAMDRARCCDLVLPGTDADGLAAVATSVEANPLAATALALLLRGSDGRTVDDGLHAESAVYSTLQAGPEFAAWRAGRPIRSRDEPADAVHLERDGDRLTITLSRPAVRNALNRTMRDQLLAGLALAEADPSILEVHLRGAGPAFGSGGDLDEFGSAPDPATAHLIRLTASVGRAIERIRPKVTAHLHGTCAGSGIELPAFAGRIVATPDTTITLPEVGLGLVPGAGGTVSLPRRIGRHRTAELALAGRTLDADTARRWGLVDEVAGSNAGGAAP